MTCRLSSTNKRRDIPGNPVMPFMTRTSGSRYRRTIFGHLGFMAGPGSGSDVSKGSSSIATTERRYPVRRHPVRHHPGRRHPVQCHRHRATRYGDVASGTTPPVLSHRYGAPGTAPPARRQPARHNATGTTTYARRHRAQLHMHDATGHHATRYDATSCCCMRPQSPNSVPVYCATTWNTTRLS